MNCDQIRPNLSAYLDGEVTDEERAQIEAHLATCSECADELAHLQSLQADLRDAVPAGLNQLRLPRPAQERIRERLRRVQARRTQRQRGFSKTLRRGLAGLLRPRPALVKAAIPLIVALFLVLAGLVGTLPVPVSAQETIVISPATFAPDTDAALRVIVRDQTSAQPIPGAEISVRLRPRDHREVLLYSGRTGSQGTADVRFHVPLYAQDSVSADLVVTSTSPQGRDQVTQRVTVRRSFRVYLTSDKPLYQPGQTIHLRALALDAAQGRPAADRRVLFRVQGTSGERVFEKSVRASSYGIAATDYVLHADADRGSYRVIAALGDTVSARTVTVGRYQRPRFKVDLSPARSYYLPGEVVKGRVMAHLFEARPLPGATATLRAYLHDPKRRLVATVQGRTDVGGTFSFSFGLPSNVQAEQANLALEASVADETGHIEWAGRVLPVAAEPLAVDVVAEGGRLRPGVENVVYVLTATPDGAPAPARLALDVAGKTHELTTDGYGLARFRFVPGLGVRDVQVKVTARDAEGRHVTRTVTLSADRGPAQVLLRLDRAAYEVGETMRLEVLAGQGEIVHLDVVHRNQGQTLSTHVARLRVGRAELALDVSPQMVGTLELHAYQVLPDGTLARDARLAVVDAPVQVAVDVRADESAYRPGDVAHVAIRTQTGGRPVQSAVGIAVVDESVFALEERAPGFAKLFFLLEKSLLERTALPLGVPLQDLLDPSEEAEVRAAQDQAARTAWAKLPAGDLDLQRSTPAQPAAAARARSRFQRLGRGLVIALLGIPIALWILVVRRLWRPGSWGPALWRTALVLLGLVFFLIVPTMAAALVGLFLLLGEMLGTALLVFLLVAWLAALVALGIYAWRRGDDSAQIAASLVAAYGILGALTGYVAERGGDPGLGPVLGVAAAFIAALTALLLLTASLWVEKRPGAAGAALALTLLSVALVVLAGAALATSSLFVQTLTDPGAYAGPAAWLTGCSPASKREIVEKTMTQAGKETVVAEKEVKVTKVAEKEAAKEVEKAATVTPAAQPTPTAVATPAATASPQPLPTMSPTVVPTASPTASPAVGPMPISEPPPPLLGQFIPETIYWAAEAITDEAGHLELDIPLPGVQATWRLTALASTRQGQLGAATANLHVGP